MRLILDRLAALALISAYVLVVFPITLVICAGIWLWTATRPK